MAEFPITLATLVSRVKTLLHDMAQQDTLGAAVSTTTTTSVTVTTASMWSKGSVMEVDNELMLITADLAGSVATVTRGFMGTTAATHSNGAVATKDPRYARKTIIEAINVSLCNWLSMYIPRLVWDSATQGTLQGNKTLYTAPADALNISRAIFQVPGSTSVKGVEFGPLQPFPTTLCSTGVGFEVYTDKNFWAGQTLHVCYEKAWTFLEADADTVPSDFPPLGDDLIVTGAAVYILGWRLAPRLTANEITFYRESNIALPSNVSMQALEMMKRDWTQGVQRLSSHRPQHGYPRKVWRG